MIKMCRIGIGILNTQWTIDSDDVFNYGPYNDIASTSYRGNAYIFSTLQYGIIPHELLKNVRNPNHFPTSFSFRAHLANYRNFQKHKVSIFRGSCINISKFMTKWDITWEGTREVGQNLKGHQKDKIELKQSDRELEIEMTLECIALEFKRQPIKYALLPNNFAIKVTSSTKGIKILGFFTALRMGNLYCKDLPIPYLVHERLRPVW